MTDTAMISEAIKTNIDQIVETEDSTDRTQVSLDTNKIIGKIFSQVMVGILTDKIAEESIEILQE